MGTSEVVSIMRTYLIAVTLLAGFVFAGCAAKDPPKPPANDTPATETVATPDASEVKKVQGGSTAMPADVAAPDTSAATTERETPAPKEDAASSTAYPYEQVIASANSDNLMKDYKECEDALQENPDSVDLKMQRVYLIYNAGQMLMSRDEREPMAKAFRTAFEAAEQLVKELPDLTSDYRTLIATVYYNGACVQALDGQAEAARDTLSESIKLGWSELDAIKNDPDLASVRALSSYETDLANWTQQIQQVVVQQAKDDLAKGETFPFDVQVESLTGTPIKLADFLGKVVFVDIWGTWCPPCRAEIPTFVKLQEQYSADGFQMIGLNYENSQGDEAKKLVQDFIDANGINYPCALGTEEIQSQVPNFEGYPTTLLIDRTGKVRLKLVGMHDEAYFDALLKILLAEPAPAVEPPAPEGAEGGLPGEAEPAGEGASEPKPEGDVQPAPGDITPPPAPSGDAEPTKDGP